MAPLNFVKHLFRRNSLVFIFLFISAVAIGQGYIDQFNVDNLRLDGNTISSQDTDGPIIISPNGSGVIQLPGQTANKLLVVDTAGNLVSSDATFSDTEALSGLTQLDVDDIRINGDTISATDNPGDITISPNGTGKIILPSITTGRMLFLDGSGNLAPSDVTIDSAGAIGAATQLDVDNIRANGNLIQATNTNGDLTFVADGTGALNFQSNVNMITGTEVRFNDDAGGEYMGLKAPSAVTSSTTLTLPDGDGSNGQALITNGAGALDWATATGGTGKNYFTDGNFEPGVGLATAYDDTGAYVDGTGGSPGVISVSQNSTTPLRESNDLQISKSAADGSGEGVTLLSDSLDRIDQGRGLYFSAQVDSNHANYTSGDVCVKAYDVGGTAELAVVSVSGLDDDGCLTKSEGAILAKVLTTTSTTSTVRVSLHLASDSDTGSAWDIYVDDAKFSPDGSVPGFIGSDEITLESPTWTNLTVGNGTEDIRYSRVGDKMFIRGGLDFGSTTSVTGTIELDLPESLTPKDLSSASLYDGGAHFFDNGGAANSTSGSAFLSGGKLRFLPDNTNTSADATSPFTWAQNDRLSFYAIVTIDSWKATAALSTTAANEQALEVVCEVSSSTANSSFADEAFETVDYDDCSVGSQYVTTGANWVFTAPRDGRYRMEANARWAGASNLNQTTMKFEHDPDNVQIVALNSNLVGTAIGMGSATFDMDKGDTLHVELQQDDTTSSARTISTAQTDNQRNRVSITYVSGKTYFSVYGETDLQSSASTTNVTTFTTGEYKDATNITITPGTWDISAQALSTNNGAITQSNWAIAVSIYSGNTTTDHVSGDNVTQKYLPSAASGASDYLAVSPYTLTVTSDTTVYLKAVKFNTTTNFEIDSYKIQARKVK